MRRRNTCGISGPSAPRSESGMYRVFTVPPGEKPSVFMKVFVSFFLSSLRFFVKHQPLHILMDCPMPEEICQDPVKSDVCLAMVKKVKKWSRFAQIEGWS